MGHAAVKPPKPGHLSAQLMGMAWCRYKSKKKAFTKYVKKYTSGDQGVTSELEEMKKHCTVIRVLAHTQMSKIGLKQKKAHMMEIQVRSCARPSPIYTHLKAVVQRPQPGGVWAYLLHPAGCLCLGCRET